MASSPPLGLGNLGILSILSIFLVRNSDHVDIANETLYVVHVHTLYSAHHETRLRLVLSAFNSDLATLHDSKYTIYRKKE